MEPTARDVLGSDDQPKPRGRRRGRLVVAALVAIAALAFGSAIAGPAYAASGSVSTAKPGGGGGNGGGKPGGGGGGTTELEYAALGDSFASGVGTGSYLERTCSTSSKSYPKLLDADANLRLVAFPACSGASTATVISNQVPAIPATATRVTLTAGGNDVGFANVMQYCFVFQSSSCESYIVAGESLVSNGTVAANITSTVLAIRAKAPGAKIVVVGYPKLFNLPNAKYKWAERVNTGTVALNNAIEAAATGSGAIFVDVEPAFEGHGVGSGSAWINDVRYLAPAESFHPTATGYGAYAAEVRKVIG